MAVNISINVNALARDNFTRREVEAGTGDTEAVSTAQRMRSKERHHCGQNLRNTRTESDRLASGGAARGAAIFQTDRRRCDRARGLLRPAHNERLRSRGYRGAVVIHIEEGDDRRRALQERGISHSCGQRSLGKGGFQVPGCRDGFVVESDRRCLVGRCSRGHRKRNGNGKCALSGHDRRKLFCRGIHGANEVSNISAAFDE